jgi:hypothetical protein
VPSETTIHVHNEKAKFKGRIWGIFLFHSSVSSLGMYSTLYQVDVTFFENIIGKFDSSYRWLRFPQTRLSFIQFYTLCPLRDTSLDGQSMRQAWERSEMQTWLWFENLKERHHLKFLGEDGRIMLK